jgi:hypothetical protein
MSRNKENPLEARVEYLKEVVVKTSKILLKFDPEIRRISLFGGLADWFKREAFPRRPFSENSDADLFVQPGIVITSKEGFDEYVRRVDKVHPGDPVSIFIDAEISDPDAFSQREIFMNNVNRGFVIYQKGGKLILPWK